MSEGVKCSCCGAVNCEECGPYTAEAELTIESALKELQAMFPGEIFKIESEQAKRMSEAGELTQLRKSALILQVSRGLEGFYTAPTLKEAMNQVRAWSKSRAQKEGDAKSEN